MTQDAENIVGFWLGVIGEEGWYEQNDEADIEIRERFESIWRAAARGKSDDWRGNPHRTLASLILLDQFPRNMFRGDAKAFSTDTQALEIAKGAVIKGQDRDIPEPERQFFYLPYMHSEDLTDQHACVALIGDRMKTGNNLYHAKAHRAVIERFGRFPYRNIALGRASTPDERAYIEAGLYEPEGWRVER